MPLHILLQTVKYIVILFVQLQTFSRQWVLKTRFENQGTSPQMIMGSANLLTTQSAVPLTIEYCRMEKVKHVLQDW